MRIRKHINKLLLVGILINNLSVLSNAGTLSPDTRYETFTGDYIKIDDILEEDSIDIEMEGNTLVNILNLNKIIRNDGWTYNADERRGYVNLSSSSAGWTELNFDTNKNVELDREYTMFINITKNTLVRDDGNTSGNAVKFAISHDYPNENVFFIKPSQTGIIKHVFRPTESISRKPYISIVPNVGNGEFEFKDFMVVEGNYSDKDIDYFEGMKSIGEQENSNHNIEIKLQNKNLFDFENWKKRALVSGIKYRVENNSIYIENVSNSGAQKWSGCGIKAALIPGEKYTFKASRAGGSGNYVVGVKSSSGDFVADLTTSKEYIEFIVPSDGIVEFRFFLDNTAPTVGDSCVFTNIQLEQNTISTEYVDPIANKIKIGLKESLRSVPNGTKDRIIKKNGQWVIERNCEEVIFDGSDDEKWAIGTNSDDLNTIKFSIYGSLPATRGKINSLCDKFNYHGSNWVETIENDKEGFSIAGEEKYDADINIRILKSKLSTVDVNGFKQWLKDNPVKVVYKLANPKYELLNVDVSVQLFKEASYISNNSIVPTDMRVTVDRVMNRAREFSKIARLNPTVQNLSQARYWVNLMRESSFKDELQENLDNIVDISDMTMEKKSVSANADIYIKSKNTLSLSLDTNNIMFENFNGTESIEKTNAVNLTVSSSLPYKINAYLEDEIQNSDKSSVIDKSVLNIKANSDTAYKSFVDTTSPIVLLDNQVEGTYNTHGVDIRLNGGLTHKADVYKTTIKFEVEQK